MAKTTYFSVISLLLLFAIGLANAQQPWIPTASEMRLLPPYCKTKFEQGTNRTHPEVSRWFRILGDNYIDIHHYCAGMNFMSRAHRSSGDKIRRSDNLRQAEDNFKYMIKAAKPGFLLLPEIHLNYGRLFRMRDEVGPARRHFEIAIALKSDYATAYVAVAYLLLEVGDSEGAKATLETGAKMAPRSRSIKRRLRKLHVDN